MRQARENMMQASLKVGEALLGVEHIVELIASVTYQGQAATSRAS
jgi:hypothetical protein